MRRFICIKYFQGLLRLCFAKVQNVKRGVKANIENIRDIEGTKISKILRKKCISKTS